MFRLKFTSMKQVYILLGFILILGGCTKNNQLEKAK